MRSWLHIRLRRSFIRRAVDVSSMLLRSKKILSKTKPGNENDTGKFENNYLSSMIFPESVRFQELFEYFWRNLLLSPWWFSLKLRLSIIEGIWASNFRKINKHSKLQIMTRDSNTISKTEKRTTKRARTTHWSEPRRLRHLRRNTENAIIFLTAKTLSFCTKIYTSQVTWLKLLKLICHWHLQDTDNCQVLMVYSWVKMPWFCQLWSRGNRLHAIDRDFKI